MGWNRESIKQTIDERLPKDLSAEELRERLLDLSVAIYPVISVFASMDDTPRGHWFTSMLFPWDAEGEGFDGYSHHKVESSVWEHGNPSPSQIHEKRWEMAESISIGTKGNPSSIVNDDFTLLESYSECIGGQAYNGSISAKDIRHLDETYRNNTK